MTYIFNDPKLAAIVNKIDLQKQYEIGVNCDLQQIEGFLAHNQLDFDEVELPNGYFLSINDFGVFHTYMQTDTFARFCERQLYELSIARKEEAMPFILERLEDILEDMQ